ncbi:type VI secretion system contractile sheath small subunit [Paraburkholderia nemoris]
MSASSSSQKFIGRNRAPRVQIEYDVEVYGSEKKIELPFVMGVLADLSGKPTEALPPVADRTFLDIDIDNFDERMKAIRPRVAFSVPNTLSGDGHLMVDMALQNAFWRNRARTGAESGAVRAREGHPGCVFHRPRPEETSLESRYHHP